MMIVNDNSRVINKLEASLTDDARVVIYNRQMFTVTSHWCVWKKKFNDEKVNANKAPVCCGC